MDTDDFADQVAGVAALADPVRRSLYRYVAGQPEPVSRDGAAAAVGIPRHTAKFHLDKLVEQGLLDVGFQRLTGRQGPGAGRPTKLYRRSTRQLTVTLPERRYELAGQLMARAIDVNTHTGIPVRQALSRGATELGRSLGEQQRDELGPRPSGERRIVAACAVLAAHGYEPRRQANTVTLANCPFHALAREHTELVCGANLALLTGLVDGIGGGRLTARLDPSADRCCVVLDVS